MSHEPKVHSREIDRMIERQIRNWELARQQKIEQQAQAARLVEEFIALSRAVGLPGDEVASALHERLGWPMFDKQVLQTMSGDDAYQRRLYESMDERDLSWLEECLRSMGADKYPRNDYFRRLRETILAIARKSHAVFVGRAADLILPKTVGMRVRLTASRAYRVGRYAEANKLSADQAEKALEELERERAKFIKHHFGVDESDPVRHDLVINLERFSGRQAVELILTAMRIRGLGP